MVVSRSTEEAMAEIVIDGNWYLVYSSYEWRTGTSVFRSSSYDFMGKSKIDIRDGGEGGMFEALEEKQDHEWVIDNC